jgi:hypothetical protein
MRMDEHKHIDVNLAMYTHEELERMVRQRDIALAAMEGRAKKAEEERDEAIANLEALEDAEAARDQRYDIGDD